MRKATIRIKDEVNCTVIGLSKEDAEDFWEEYGIHAPNYFFAPKFQLGAWDGKIRYFTKAGNTYVNLLEEIIPRLVDLGYKVKLSDLRKKVFSSPTKIDKDFFSHIIDPRTKSPWIMRDYQVVMVNKLLEEGYGIGLAATGSGKTSMTAALALAYEKEDDMRTLIVVPDKNLTAQTIREYEFFGLDVGQYSGEKKDANHQQVVSTWQSLRNNKTLIQTFDVVIVDEAHGAKATVLKEILAKYGSKIPHRFGVTGTLPKEPSDTLTIKTVLGPVQHEIGAKELIEDGHLSTLHIEVIQQIADFHHLYHTYKEELPRGKRPLTYSQYKNSYFPDWASEKNYLNSYDERTEWIALELNERRSMKKGNVLCLVNSIRYGKKMASLIPDSIFLHGKDAMKVRREAFDLFQEHDDVVVIATQQLAGTGLDIPRIFHLVLIDPGKSFVKIIQSIGRGLRKAHDKDSVKILDMCSDTKYSKKHLSERIGHYKEAGYPYTKDTIEL